LVPLAGGLAAVGMFATVVAYAMWMAGLFN
jgi:hypothetical protein